jgi:hypothetical protein
MTITTEDEYKAAEERIAEIAGCLEDTPGEHELITLELAVEIWQSKRRHD